jgi:hypothetical protein
VAPHIIMVENEYVAEKGSNMEILFPFSRKEMKPNFMKMLKNKEIRV